MRLEGCPPSDLARRARAEVERILSLDVDGSGFPAIGERDPVVDALQRSYRGLRPVLFFSPYEAAAWAIIGQRVRITQAAAVKRRLSAELGEHGAFPAPARLAELSAPQRGLTERKIEQLRSLGHAALEGELGRTRLRRLSFEDAAEALRALPGIGPFSAELVLIRGVGWPDALPSREPRLERAVRAGYGLGDGAEIGPVAARWSPYRSWVALLLRASLEAETGEIARRGRPPSRRSAATASTSTSWSR